MNLNQLQYFKILAQEEHYTRAAQMLSITQPSLSHAIAQLEEELGTRLFEKKGRNIVLTRYGKLFLPYDIHCHNKDIFSAVPRQSCRHNPDRKRM
jgi:DNA-binding transcriptional LysR family regulator